MIGPCTTCIQLQSQRFVLHILTTHCTVGFWKLFIFAKLLVFQWLAVVCIFDTHFIFLSPTVGYFGYRILLVLVLSLLPCIRGVAPLTLSCRIALPTSSCTQPRPKSSPVCTPASRGLFWYFLFFLPFFFSTRWYSLAYCCTSHIKCQ